MFFKKRGNVGYKRLAARTLKYFGVLIYVEQKARSGQHISKVV